jgi:hypothetical protein
MTEEKKAEFIQLLDKMIAEANDSRIKHSSLHSQKYFDAVDDFWALKQTKELVINYKEKPFEGVTKL